jgi:hypothetical protein
VWLTLSAPTTPDATASVWLRVALELHSRTLAHARFPLRALYGAAFGRCSRDRVETPVAGDAPEFMGAAIFERQLAPGNEVEPVTPSLSS